MYHSSLIHLSVNGHLGCFHVLAVVNSVAMNIGVHVSLSILVSSVCMPRSGIAKLDHFLSPYTKINLSYRKVRRNLNGNALTLLVGMQTSTATMENSVEVP